MQYRTSVLEEFDKGVDCTAVLEIASEGHRKTRDCAQFLANREKVEECLRGMFD